MSWCTYTGNITYKICPSINSSIIDHVTNNRNVTIDSNIIVGFKIGAKLCTNPGNNITSVCSCNCTSNSSKCRYYVGCKVYKSCIIIIYLFYISIKRIPCWHFYIKQVGRIIYTRNIINSANSSCTNFCACSRARGCGIAII